MQIVMCKGLPASGKSTWAIHFVADQPNFRRVNKDSIRTMVGYRSSDEVRILEIRDFIIGSFLRAKLSVVVDDTNLDPKHEKRLAQLAMEHGAELVIRHFDTPLNDCIYRDAARTTGHVGEKVIRRMWKQYLAPKLQPIEYRKQDVNLNPVVICDIDGTLALITDRSPYDTAKCLQDVINLPVGRLLRRLNRVLLVSGRSDKYRTETELWLKAHDVQFESLFMRKEGDFRKDCVVKEEIYKNEIEGKYYVEFILDDRNQVVEMWRGLNLPCFQVAPGDF